MTESNHNITWEITQSHEATVDVTFICGAVHTPEVKAAYAAMLAEQEAEIAPQEEQE